MSVWACPFCPWEQRAHPDYGWSARDSRAVEVHQATLCPERTAVVILFKPSGKYYTEERWRIPEGAIGPYDMADSPDFRRIGGGAVLVESQEPWGYPHLFPEGDQ